jgi:membrane-bound metal-dependent hydrolase YbcI (DUF457 family)
MAPTHRLAGTWSGALYGWHIGLPWWACVGTAAAATLTSAGILSPDADQFKGWRRVDKYAPDELLGWGGPLKHRGITHWPALPVAAAYALHAATLSTWLTLLLWALIIGWVSHLLLDFVWGRAFGDRGRGVPLLGWTGYVGLGLDAGGVTEWLFRVGLVGAALWVGWQAVTP